MPSPTSSDRFVPVADTYSLQLVFGRNLSLNQLCCFALNIAELLRHIAAQILIDLNYLESSFGLLSFSLRGAGNSILSLRDVSLN
jgi:hypothetical protein